MILTPEQIGELVTVLVILLTALANYLNHLSVMAHVNNVANKVDQASAKIDGQGTQLASVTTDLAKQAGIAQGIALSVASQALPPNHPTEAPHE